VRARVAAFRVEQLKVGDNIVVTNDDIQQICVSMICVYQLNTMRV